MNYTYTGAFITVETFNKWVLGIILLKIVGVILFTLLKEATTLLITLLRNLLLYSNITQSIEKI